MFGKYYFQEIFGKGKYMKYQNIREAADCLGMDSSTFVRKRQRYEKLGLMTKEKKKN